MPKPHYFLLAILVSSSGALHAEEPKTGGLERTLEEIADTQTKIETNFRPGVPFTITRGEVLISRREFSMTTTRTTEMSPDSPLEVTSKRTTLRAQPGSRYPTYWSMVIDGVRCPLVVIPSFDKKNRSYALPVRPDGTPLPQVIPFNEKLLRTPPEKLVFEPARLVPGTVRFSALEKTAIDTEEPYLHYELVYLDSKADQAEFHYREYDINRNLIPSQSMQLTLSAPDGVALFRSYRIEFRDISSSEVSVNVSNR